MGHILDYPGSLALSPFVKEEIFAPNKSIYYHSLWGNAVLCTDRTASFLNRFRTPTVPFALSARYKNSVEVADAFAKKGFLIQPGIDDRENLHQVRHQFLQSITGMMPWIGLGFFVTNECNFNCTYCVMKKMRLDSPRYSLQWRAAKEIVDAFYAESIHLGRDMIYLGLTGGEPLLYWKTVRTMWKYIDSYYGNRIQTKLLVNTNLSLVTDEVAKAFAEYGVSPNASLDGLEETNNRVRILIDGKGMYYEIVNKIALLRQQGVIVDSAYMVLTDNTFDFVEQDLVEFAIRQGFKRLTVEPDLVAIGHRSPEEISEKLLMLVQIARQSGVEVKGFWKRPFEVLVSRKKPIDRLAFCTSLCAKSVAVLADGRLSACAFSRINLGNATNFKGSWAASEYVNFINRNLAGNIPECVDCFLEGICMGGCRITRECSTDSNDPNLFEHRCAIYRQMTRGLLKQLVSNAKPPQFSDSKMEVVF